MKIALFLILGIIFITSTGIFPVFAANITIIEVEPNPAGSDSGKEWVKLFNPEKDSVNLSGWSINSTSGEVKSHNLSGNISSCGEKTIFFPGEFLENQNESLILYDESGRVVDSTKKLSDRVDNEVTFKMKVPKCAFNPENTQSKPPPEVKITAEPIEQSSPESTEPSNEIIEKTTTDDGIDLGVSFEVNDEALSDLGSNLQFLVIVIAAIIVGIIVLLLIGKRKKGELPEGYEKKDKSVIENAPLLKKFEDMKEDPSTSAANKFSPNQIIKDKLRIISKLQEENIGDQEKIETIKESLLSGEAFTFTDSNYLDTQYEEYKKIKKDESEI